MIKCDVIWGGGKRITAIMMICDWFSLVAGNVRKLLCAF